MKLQNAKAQMRKGVIEYSILHVLENRSLYISEMIESMEKSKIIEVEVILYPMLIKLKNEGYLEFRWEESFLGPPRKFYEITDTGKLFLKELGRVWNEPVDAVFTLNNCNGTKK